MKELLHSAFIQKVVAFLLYNYLAFCLKTTRWERIDQEPVEALWASGGPVVLMMWHGRLHYSHACWPGKVFGAGIKAQPVSVLASLSKSGEVSVKINTRFGYHSIRGSSAKKSDPAKPKGGAQAFRDMLRWLKAGGCMAMTPDGPRGPARVMTEGSLKMSQICQAPLALVGQATKNYIQLKSWDNMRVPLPFTRGAVIWEVLPPIPADADDRAFEALRLQAEEALTRVTNRADAMMGHAA